jgi:hypothetical protein
MRKISKLEISALTKARQLIIAIENNDQTKAPVFSERELDFLQQRILISNYAKSAK